MKKIYSIVLVAFAIVAAASCAKEAVPAENIQEEIQNNGKVEMVFDVSVDGVKSTLTDDLKVYFVDGDEIAVYDGIAAEPNKFIVESASGNNAVIRGTVSEGATSFVAVYPFTAAAGFNESGVTVSVPASQVIPAGKNIDPNALVSAAMAKAGESMKFQNVVSLLKFTVSANDVNIVNIKSNADEAFIGKALVTAESISVNGSAALTVQAEGDNAAFAAGTYYAAVLPAQLSKGIGVFVQKAEGYAYKLSENTADIVRNAGLNLGTIDGVAFPAEIKTRTELLAFARFSTIFPAGYEAKLGADIDLQGAYWPNPNFYGTFDGQNHRVYNFTTTNRTAMENVGFIGTLGDGTNAACVKNICFGSKDYDFGAKTGTYDGVSKITFGCTTDGTTYKYPGPVAYAHKGSTVENVVNFMNIEVLNTAKCKHRNGGICGTMKANVTVKDCVNYGNIVDNSEQYADASELTMGGVSGYIDGANSKIINSINYGTLTSNGKQVTVMGGITGCSAYVASVEDCTNYGNISHKGDIAAGCYTGGIVGQLKTNVTGIKNCKNYGSITVADGNVTKTTLSGGIVGQVSSSASTFDTCENHGDINLIFGESNAVTAAVEAGGIAAYCNATATFSNCSNSGNITIGKCTSNNLVEIGGILGRNVSAVSTITDCSNTRNITNGLSTNYATSSDVGGVSIGGIVGRTHQATKVTNCSANCDITNSGKSTKAEYFTCTKVGGLFGYSQSTPVVTNVSYKGTVTANEDEGGTVSAYSTGTGWSNANVVAADGCTIDAKLDIKKAAETLYAGGLVGYMKCSKAKAYSATKVKCIITGAPTTYGGMIMGHFDTASSAVLTVGTAGTDPVQVAGSFNGTAITAANLDSFVKGTESTSDKLVINAALLAE